jgi:hypothetical protein
VTGAAIIKITRDALPATYERAKAALAECADIDECRDWSDRAEAMAAYAQMRRDRTLFNLARRIQLRAKRKYAELEEFFDARGAHRKKVRAHLSSKREIAAAAGISEHEAKTCRRLAAVPEEVFNAAVESENPPSVTALAAQGIRRRAPARPAPAGTKEATRALGAIRRLAELSAEHRPETIAAGIAPDEIPLTAERIAAVQLWLGRLKNALEGRP